MRKFYILLVLFIFSAAGLLNAQSVQKSIEQNVSARVKQAQAAKPQHAAGTATLAQQAQNRIQRKREEASRKKAPQSLPRADSKAATSDTWDGLPIISWEEYARASQQATQKQEKFNQLLGELYNLDDVKFRGLYDGLSIHQGTPNYAKAVANTKYIYIGEYHDTPVVQQEIKKLIRAVQKANPGKKILLATEFSGLSHPLINPLHLNGKDWLIGEGGTSYNIDQLADELRLDTLALDDEIIQFQNSDFGLYTLAKVGDRYVRAGLDNQSTNYNEQAANLFDFAAEQAYDISGLKSWPKEMLYTNFFAGTQKGKEAVESLLKTDTTYTEKVTKQYGPGNEKYIALYSMISIQRDDISIPDNFLGILSKSLVFQNALLASQWGVLQRNHQWDQRIRQVAEKYDVVIVWAGLGHFREDIAFPDVITLLKQTNAVTFMFSPISEEAIGEKTLQDTRKRENSLLQQQLISCSVVEFDEDKINDQAKGFCKKAEAIDFTKTYFVEDPNKNGNEGNETLSPQVQAIVDQLEQLTHMKDSEIGYQGRLYDVFLQ